MEKYCSEQLSMLRRLKLESSNLQKVLVNTTSEGNSRATMSKPLESEACSPHLVLPVRGEAAATQRRSAE